MAANTTHALVRRMSRRYVEYYAHKGRHVVAARAEAQHREYVRALKHAGLNVAFVDADDSLPDCVFIEDTAIICDRQALITRMQKDREGEQAAVEGVLRRTHTISRLADGATLDGGDVLHVGDVSYVGMSTRTDEAGAESLAAFLAQFGRRVIKVPVRNCLHLKTGMTSLGSGTLVAVPGWFEMSLFEVDDVIYTEADEHGCANCLRVGDHLFIPDGYGATGLKLERFADAHGVQVKRLGISEFEKGDGSLTCLSLIW